MSLNRVENLRHVGVPGFGSPHGPGSGGRANPPDPIDPLGSSFSEFLPLVVMSGVASIRLAAGFARGEPMGATMWFLSVLLGLCVIGLVDAVVRRIRRPPPLC